MKIYVDSDVGYTDGSLSLLKNILRRHGELDVISIKINRYEEFSFQVHAKDRSGEDIHIVLSGLNCGYRGTGPNGTLEALEMLGFSIREIKEDIYSYCICTYSKDFGWAFFHLSPVNGGKCPCMA